MLDMPPPLTDNRHIGVGFRCNFAADVEPRGMLRVPRGAFLRLTMAKGSRTSECVGKKVYLSFAEAQRACRKVEIDTKDDRHLVPYKCHHCHCWHAGNQAIAPTKRDDNARKRWKNWRWWEDVP
jgi:hypothetical protein